MDVRSLAGGFHLDDVSRGAEKEFKGRFALSGLGETKMAELSRGERVGGGQGQRQMSGEGGSVSLNQNVVSIGPRTNDWMVLDGYRIETVSCSSFWHLFRGRIPRVWFSGILTSKPQWGPRTETLGQNPTSNSEAERIRFRRKGHRGGVTIPVTGLNIMLTFLCPINSRLDSDTELFALSPTKFYPLSYLSSRLVLATTRSPPRGRL